MRTYISASSHNSSHVPTYLYPLKKQCCESGSGIRDPVLFDPWIRDPGWKKIRIRHEHSGFYFWVYSLIYGSGSGIFYTLDPGWKNSDPGFRIRNKHPGSAILLKRVDIHDILHSVRWSTILGSRDVSTEHNLFIILKGWKLPLPWGQRPMYLSDLYKDLTPLIFPFKYLVGPHKGFILVSFMS